MEILRKVGQFELNKGDGMANGSYNMVNRILMDNTENEGVSYWFDKDTADMLLRMSDSEFVDRAKQYAGNGINDLFEKGAVFVKKTNGVRFEIISHDYNSVTYHEVHYFNSRVEPITQFLTKFKKELKKDLV